jgi:hypothetical protein
MGESYWVWRVSLPESEVLRAEGVLPEQSGDAE